MLQNYYTLEKLAKEFQQLIGMKVISCFSQERDTITFVYYDGSKETYLHFSVVPFCCSLFIYKDFTRAKSNSIALCSTLLGDYLQSVEVIEDERILLFRYIKHTIVFHIFGGANGNCFLLDNSNDIIFALSQSEKYIGNSIDAIVYKNTRKQNNDFLLGSIYEQEMQCKNMDIADFANYLLQQDNVYILQKNGNTILSLIQLAEYDIVKEFASISDAVKYQSISQHIALRKADLHKQLLPPLLRQQKRLSKNINLAEDLEEPLERADRCRIYAELLMSQPNIKQRPGDKIELKDWNGNDKQIELDANKTLLENANIYYTKSRKALQDAAIRQKRLPKLKAELAVVLQKIDDVNNAINIRDLEKLKKEIMKESIVIMPQEERPIESKFRTFALGDGFTLYVGKNAANNDELTMKFAKPNDIWLHSRGSSGSHCVVKGGNVEGKLPKPILKAAASIAAYYSGAKNAKYVPVCYTQKKYVHKPKGAAQGAVTLQREDTIMVEPKLPIEAES
ncbi:MAG: NFACT RNA binding domain-containing protein [Ignavibacteria bacterium]|jgi:predicted ribosome quality control (RQC) complex YloA/Tae2 family protein|nr:NFACT RNA binding domain-containing protein [Ignavibacteria bacterium]